MENILCTVCETPFIPLRADAQYCSANCRQAAFRMRQRNGHRPNDTVTDHTAIETDNRSETGFLPEETEIPTEEQTDSRYAGTDNPNDTEEELSVTETRKYTQEEIAAAKKEAYDNEYDLLEWVKEIILLERLEIVSEEDLTQLIECWKDYEKETEENALMLQFFPWKNTLIKVLRYLRREVFLIWTDHEQANKFHLPPDLRDEVIRMGTGLFWNSEEGEWQ